MAQAPDIMNIWRRRIQRGQTKAAPQQEKLQRQDSVRIIPGFDIGRDAGARGGKGRAGDFDGNVDASSQPHKGSSQHVDRSAKKPKSLQKKRKEGLIVVRQFIIYGIFVVAVVHTWLYQAGMESPSYCLPGQDAAALPGRPYACYQPLPATLDAATAFAGFFNPANVYGLPEYAVELTATLSEDNAGTVRDNDDDSDFVFYHMRGNYPHTNHVLHILVPVLAGCVAMFYGLWRFLRHHQVRSFVSFRCVCECEWCRFMCVHAYVRACVRACVRAPPQTQMQSDSMPPWTCYHTTPPALAPTATHTHAAHVRHTGHPCTKHTKHTRTTLHNPNTDHNSHSRVCFTVDSASSWPTAPRWWERWWVW